MKRNGKCQLEYRGEIIKSIEFPASLLKSAQNSPIKDYLSGNVIVVNQFIPMSDIEFNNYMNRQRIHPGTITTEDSSRITKGYPTREKCIHIMNWLTNSSNK